MKKIKLFFNIIMLLLLAFAVTSCMSPAKESGMSGGDIRDDGFLSDAEIYSKVEGFVADGGSSEKVSDFLSIQAGQITSTALNDHKYFDLWLEELNKQTSFAETYNSFVTETQMLEAKEMCIIKIHNGENPLKNVKVEILIGQNSIYTGYTDVQGIVYVFYNIHEVDAILTFRFNDTIEKTDRDAEISGNVFDFNIDLVVNDEQNVLDLALVVDTTGSMGDELEYLKVELKDVLERVQTLDININLALIFYRDEGDAYVTRVFDFTNDLTTQYTALGRQTSSGGGDYPEAVHKALQELNNLSWSQNSTKLAIHVCDAPIHGEYKLAFARETIKLVQKGIRMIPVICSGSDSLCEVTFRLAALHTGGRYTYITNHSGIGGGHADATTSQELVVEYLNKMLERLIKFYVTGVEDEPVPYYSENIALLTLIDITDEEQATLYKKIYIVLGEEITLKEILVEEFGDFENVIEFFSLDEEGNYVAASLEDIITQDATIYLKKIEAIENVEG